jgi:hypothetical protein
MTNSRSGQGGPVLISTKLAVHESPLERNVYRAWVRSPFILSWCTAGTLSSFRIAFPGIGKAALFTPARRSELEVPTEPQAVYDTITYSGHTVDGVTTMVPRVVAPSKNAVKGVQFTSAWKGNPRNSMLSTSVLWRSTQEAFRLRLVL